MIGRTRADFWRWYFCTAGRRNKNPGAFWRRRSAHSIERNVWVTSAIGLLVAYELSKINWRARGGSAVCLTVIDMNQPRRIQQSGVRPCAESKQGLNQKPSATPQPNINNTHCHFAGFAPWREISRKDCPVFVKGCQLGIESEFVI
jgi:hypothetical protein